MSPSFASTSQLLCDIFGRGGTTSERYLEWLYSHNPAGVVIDQNVDDADGRIGHYAVVPKKIARGSDVWTVALSLNTAVATRAQGRGMFSELAANVIEKCKAQDVAGIIGVANANSTPGFVRRLKFNLEMSLPTVVGVSIPSAGKGLYRGADAITRIALMEETRRLASPEMASPLWTKELLEWRLSRPDAAYFAIATDREGVVGTKTRQGELPFACLLGLFSRSPDGRPDKLVSAACGEAGTPFYVHAGWNRDIRVQGIPVPRRLRPAPLNLIWRDLRAESGIKDIGLSPKGFRRFEFIDFDAY